MSNYIGKCWIKTCCNEGYELGDAIREAIVECWANDIMTDYLKAKGSEAINMLNAEWDWDKAREVWAKEERAVGRAEGRLEGRMEEQSSIIQSLSGVMSPEMIAATLYLSLDYVQTVL